MLKRLLLMGLLFIPVAAWAFAKPIRVAAPGLAEVSCISDTLCTDDVSRLREIVGLYDEALRFVDASVGVIQNKPRVIFCGADACAQFFGMGQRAGVTVGTFGIAISPRAWKPHYVRHEIIHHLQNEKLGIVRAWFKPTWFMEGMAYSLSEDPRPKLSEPFEEYRARFESWYAGVGKTRLWESARSL